jgi:CheY-like chemotaxis protein
MLNQTESSTRAVLVVDDSEDDVLLLSMSIQHAGIPWKIVGTVSDGEEAITWLEKAYSGKEPMPRVDLLLIDLKMPRRDGFDVLQWVQKNLPGRFQIAVFSSSFEVSDIIRARDLGASYYHVKPVSTADRRKTLLHLECLLAGATQASHEAAVDDYFEAILNAAP